MIMEKEIYVNPQTKVIKVNFKDEMMIEIGQGSTSDSRDCLSAHIKSDAQSVVVIAQVANSLQCAVATD